MRKWKKFRLEISSAAEEAVTAVLAECGIMSVEIEDKLPLTDEEKKYIFSDVMPEDNVDDGRAYVSFYLEENADDRAILADVRKALAGMRAFVDPGPCTIEFSETAEEDWINNWKKYFHTFSIDDVLIVPSWEKVPSDASAGTILHLDPGTAFGTGKHETTRSCIRALSGHIKNGDRMLDIGTGSGILMLLSLKLGASHGVGTDLDPCAVPAVRQNMENNGIDPSRYEFYLGNLITDQELRSRIGHGSFDIAAANILSEVLLPMMPASYELLKPGGIYITGGIIDTREKDVKESLENNGFRIIETIRDGEWICFVSQKERRDV